MVFRAPHRRPPRGGEFRVASRISLAGASLSSWMLPDAAPHGIGRRPKRKRRSPCGLRRSCSSLTTYGPRSSVQQLHRSVHPLDPVARVTMSLRASLYGLLASTRSLTNDEPRHQPARPETRPNQRLYVPSGSPPLVAVGSSSARTTHRSRAPQTDTPRMTQNRGAGKEFKA